MEVEANADSPQLKGPRAKGKAKAGGKQAAKAKASPKAKSPSQLKRKKEPSAQPKQPSARVASSSRASTYPGVSRAEGDKDSVRSGGSGSKKRASGV